MSTSLLDTLRSISAVKASDFCPTNNEANTAERNHARRGCSMEQALRPMSLFCLKSGGISE